MMPTKSILFVCLGNICRSPTGEGIFQSLLQQQGLEDQISVDSAGTIGFHTGHAADQRMQQAATKRGYRLLSLSRKIIPTDLETFDLIIAMDRDNLHDIQTLHDVPSAEIKLLSDFLGDEWPSDVPDPYYGGHDGFEYVLDMIEAASPEMLSYLQAMP